ncbi:hypothetical protein GOP47_0025252 [Adiantum capillus-veneris]|uniref:BHLH domain-containing protein n=1 Tax=Adiantum capillus-veneris TaxID=13818 RepID=A0A9D4U0D3_ADICA|nr:hypothetical protein GOP47_0025252 [Adiantum capillus-veneris]
MVRTLTTRMSFFLHLCSKSGTLNTVLQTLKLGLSCELISKQFTIFRLIQVGFLALEAPQKAQCRLIERQRERPFERWTAMDSLPDVNVAKPPLKRGSSFDNSVMDGSPNSGFTSTDYEGHHIQAPQRAWGQTPVGQMDAAQFGFMEDQGGDTRRLLPTFFVGNDGGYGGNGQFGSPVVGSSTWDNKLSYMSSASSGIAGIPLGITGNSSSLSGHGQMQGGLAQMNAANSLGIAGHGHMHGGLVHVSTGPGHAKTGLDYVQPVLEHMQAHINGDVSSGKMMMLPQTWVPLNGSSPMDPSSEGLPTQGMNFAAPHCLPSLPADPGFADRAARFSPFGNMGFSESHLTGDGNKDLSKAKLMKPAGGQFGYMKRSAPTSPNGYHNSNNGSKSQENMRFSLKEAASAVPMEESSKGVETRSSLLPTVNMGVEGEEGGAQKQFCASVNESDESMGQEVSSSCGVAPMQGLSENSGRKRKAGSHKLKDGGGLATNPKDTDPDDGRPKCQVISENIFDKNLKPQEQCNSGNSEESTPKSAKETSKPPEAPKPDFIHVRARRGQATDSHSLAERVRREKISERMKFLQDLVPGCSKVTGKAVMLDEIINYVQSLQRQVEFLSMKLAAVNPRVEFSIDNLFARERPVQRVATPASAFGLQNPNLFPPLHPHQQPHVPIPSLDQCPPLDVQPFGSDPALRRTMSTPPSMEAYGDSAAQAAQAWDDELQSVVQMSLAQRQAAMDLQGSMFQGQMKVEH